MSKVLTVTDEAVLKAASECPDAKRVLTSMFPDVFKPKDNRIIFPEGSITWFPDGSRAIELRHGSLKGLNGSLYLSSNAVWTLEKDGHGDKTIVLVARRHT